MSEQRLWINIIAMGHKFNCLLLTLGLWVGMWPSIAKSQPAQPLPLILPESTFQTLPRITGNLINQRMMDSHSIIRMRFTDPSQALPPNTSLIVFRQGLRLKGSDGQALGVLAIPVAQGQTLSQAMLDHDIANPADTSSGWFRISAMRQEVMRGDSIMSRSDAIKLYPGNCERTAPPNDKVLPPVKVLAQAGQTDMMASVGALIIVSGGCQNGLDTGDRLTIWRDERSSFGRRLDPAVEDPKNSASTVFDDNPDIRRELSPGHRVGSGTVVASYPSVAIVQIHQVSQAVQSGDLIRRVSKTQQQPPNHESIVPKK
jgi:hypothetical protein